MLLYESKARLHTGQMRKIMDELTVIRATREPLDLSPSPNSHQGAHCSSLLAPALSPKRLPPASPSKNRTKTHQLRQPIRRIERDQDRPDTRTRPLQTRIRTVRRQLVAFNPSSTSTLPQELAPVTHLLFPMITPTLSPFLTPMPSSPRARACMCRSNSPKSHARCGASPRLRPRGPPNGRGSSLRETRAGREPCTRRTSSRKYAGRVFSTSGGCVGPATSESARGPWGWELPGLLEECVERRRSARRARAGALCIVADRTGLAVEERSGQGGWREGWVCI